MTDKTLYTLKMGGNDVTLKFRIGTLKRLKGLLGKDPFEAARQEMTETEALHFAEQIVIAGAQAQDPSLQADNITAAFEDLTPGDAGKVIAAFLKAYTPDAAPEGGKDTQSGEGADS